MKFPRYWSKATFEALGRNGERASACCWRASDQSQEEARRLAFEAARQIAQRRLHGESLGAYGYGQRTLREEVIQTKADERGDVDFGITRNSYGVLVLNTARVMFVDVDLPPPTAGERWKHFFARLCGSKRPPPEVQREMEVEQKLERFLEDHPRWGVRLYRTYGGFRLLVTHAPFDPATGGTCSLMESLDADPLYIRLCREQECFRARLTPKPWRCGHEPNRIVWPHETDDQRRDFESWLGEYQRRHQGYTTCRLIRTLGSDSIDPAVAPVIEIHDHVATSEKPLPLA